MPGGLFDRAYYTTNWKLWADKQIKYLLNFTRGLISVVRIRVDNLVYSIDKSYPVSEVGESGWNSEDGCIDTRLLNNVTLQNGQEVFIYIKASEIINNGGVVQYESAQGDHVLAKNAVQSEVNIKPSLVLGVATQNIAKNAFGYITVHGNVNDVYTTGFTAGDYIYYDSNPASAPGAITNIRPTAPNAVIILGAVLRASTGGSENGKITISVDARPRLTELSDMYTPALATNDLIAWNDTNKRFEVTPKNRFGDVAGGNYSEFDADGSLKYYGAATMFYDISGAATSLQQVGTGVSNNIPEQVVEFVTLANLGDYMATTVQLMHSTRLGSIIYPHLHYWQDSINVPNMLIQYRWQINGGVKTTAWTNLKCNTKAFTYTPGTTLHQILVPSSGITPPAGYSLSDCIQFRIIRDNANTSTVFSGVDPLNATVQIITFDVHIEKDQLGSATEYAK